MVVTPSNELDAVNEVLASVGSSPISSLDDDLNVDAINARRIVEATSKEIQAKGWGFNTLSSTALEADIDNLVPCPDSYIRFFSDGYKLIRRDGHFFDLVNNTNEFEGGLTVDELVVELPFDELPATFRKYITAKSARIFQARYVGSDDLSKLLQVDEAEAYMDVVDYDLMQGAYNIYDDDQTISQNIQRS